MTQAGRRGRLGTHRGLHGSLLRRSHFGTTIRPADFGQASILRDGRVVFNIGGNKYRLVVWVNYAYRVVYIRFIGTHAQYDEIDAQTV
ncbi:MAG TPA: hypothetical protein DD490_10540 [Acidobacteria bacterium]|nr:hypothetical protein [Acidobacteriota bacterium]